MENIRLEPKIKNLVEAFWLWGIETIQSCEGHEKYREHFPWVIIDIKYLEIVQELIYQYNNNGDREIHWKTKIYSDVSFILMPVEIIAPLNKLQQSADKLAEEIKNKKRDY